MGSGGRGARLLLVRGNLTQPARGIFRGAELTGERRAGVSAPPFTSIQPGSIQPNSIQLVARAGTSFRTR